MKIHPIRSRRVLLCVTGADILESVRVLNVSGIPIYRFTSEEPLTASMEINRKYLTQSRTILEKRGDLVKIRRSPTLPLLQYLITRRPLLTVGLALLCLVILFLPTRVLFVEVAENHIIPDRIILEAADSAGIRLFAPRRAVRSEKMKNALLSQIPGLQWAGVNTYGCRAVISVQERAAPEPVEVRNKIVSSIVASRDGIIQSATAISGSLSCWEGQAVKKGQILISGYTDCGLCIQATRASGEIYAGTNHTLSGVIPAQVYKKTEYTERIKHFSLVLGKKRIKFWKDSGIWDSTCGRIYIERPLTLPGGYTLPVSFACDIILARPVQEEVMDAKAAEKLLRTRSEDYLKGQMIAGTIQKSREVFSKHSDFYLLSGKFDCVEMIGRERLEKIGEQYGKNS